MYFGKNNIDGQSVQGCQFPQMGKNYPQNFEHVHIVIVLSLIKIQSAKC